MISVEEFSEKMEEDGYVIFDGVIPMSLTESMWESIGRAERVCARIQATNGVNDASGTVHHLVGIYKSFILCLEHFKHFDHYLENYFGGKYILNSFGGNILRGHSYANNIHRDQRSFSENLNLMMNTIITLDPFTRDNGATWLMKGSHRIKDMPTEKEFSKNAFQIIAPAGSLIMFNSNLWHRAGINKTHNSRRSVTPMFCRPFIKPGFDYCRTIGHEEVSHLSPYLKQVLGYHARIPTTLHEWYQPKEKRFYQPDQG